MIVPDVNVLVYAHREDMDEHGPYREWLDWLVNAGPAYGMSEMVLSSFVRVVTNRRTFREPTETREALASAARLLEPPQCVPVRPGPRHWEIFDGLCRRHAVASKLVADAYLAAIVMEAGCDLATADRDFARFEGLRWQHPLAGKPGGEGGVVMEPRRRPWLTSD
ncbi:MAG: type II toxin-antitoxin system VapC family toxin [Acidobacteriota bacterium]|nr:type II toxin-antitoxin system VapC family toxin [Acidobacteriota bacterium]